MTAKNNMFDLPKSFIKLKPESGSVNAHYSIFHEDFPEEFKLIARKELNETEDSRIEGLEKLKKFSKKANLPDIGEYQLLMILRYCKFNTEKSKAKLKSYISGRKELKNKLREMGLKKIHNIIDDMPFGVLPYRDKHGKCIIFNRLGAVNLEKYGMFDVCVLTAALVLFLLNYPITTVAGFACLGECEVPSFCVYYPIFKGVKRYLPLLISLPIRIARVEILNENCLIRYFYKIISPILSKKVVDRFSFHGDTYDNLHEVYDPDILPEEFGGSLGPLNTTMYKEKLLAFIMDVMNESI